MSSIASSKRGRPNTARDDDYLTVVGDFRSVIYKWRGWEEQPQSSVTDSAAQRERMREEMQLTADEEFELRVDCMSRKDYEAPIELDRETLGVPAGVKISRGPVGVYRYELFRVGVIRFSLEERFLRIEDDAETLDLVSARNATEAEIRRALNWTPPPPEPEPAAPEPTFNRLPRSADDPCSYLGFSLGKNERDIRCLPGHWAAVAFNLASAQVIGHVSVSLEFQSNDLMELRLFTATGVCKLQLELRGDRKFDQVRLPAGDLLLAFRCAGPMEGRGSHAFPHSRLIRTLPEKPDLNSLVLWPQPDTEEITGVSCAVPVFTFGS